MGACCSSPEDKYEAKPASKDSAKPAKSTSGASSKKPSTPDFGLASTHEVLKLLGRGGEGETWLCKEKSSGNEVAIKLIKRPIPKPAIAVIKREIKIQADLGQGHLNIVSADEVLLSKTHLGLVMEYVPGGNMVNYVTKKRETKAERGGLCLDEEEAHYYFLQLISAVEYCHKNNVAHRDLKLDNTLLDHHNPPWLKLCDFGFAKHWQANSNMDTMRIGTPEYMGPELISSRTGYDGKKVDVWAAGVLLFVMLAGMFPFETQDDNFNNTAGLYDIWLQQIKTSWRDLPNNSNAVLRLTPELKDLLDKMFDVKQDSRIDVPGIKASPWFKRPLPPKYEASMKELARQQALIDEQVQRGEFHNAERDKQLEALLDKAATVALPTEEVQRMSLSKVKQAAAAAAANMGTVAEEE
uniref:Protein kinase domain-containing protein n=1 Tax=Chlamydomonas leiostraca TaxID=1034604 RepID=A0A7S0R4T5_9CHLO|mmetsp:Transcript_13647/g.33573  ORF Transcript_13647/g.33573 Transcript_13647/m.33573 type:complete len:411 (+) Transcript_13647:326-1558(+)|eukprot:CAMPEP_0202857144 /NCGR_PEP_ID=MMETSP1391-20130828/189_1 /ASSEMBLY_ACC=CAM_ASM_000867 /TAXON_ID=1034604 /ORGANISM="Chlamydomonas leiostraca, Strain SAG 11-49" /LENGTH=410 /DNA_ID=CAMNT_0049535907 /DNA_START=326 /DNA_END=1558 /DNA_ORIENTATION=-